MEVPPTDRRFRGYIDALEEEQRKIQVFQRELPLCMQLVSHAIETCKQQMATEILFPGRSDGEATSSESPVLEFIPIKRSSSSEGDKSTEKDERTPKKPDWLRSVQLWTQDTDPPPKEERRSLVEPKKAGGAFHPFNREDKRTAASAPGPAAAASSTAETGSGRDEKEGQSTNRKARRCWSPELHRRFLHALHQLGGCHAATPKQIRDLMKVDGLTNDEVKSHLQKYRLHTRRPCPSGQATNPPPPQFVVVGGIWVPPPEYTTAVAAGGQPSDGTSRPASEIYAPVATLPQSPNSQQKQKKPHQSPSGPLNSEGRGSRELQSVGDDSAQSHSPATSSSSRTTTTSPAY
ncbi:transcription factor NIGT1 [Aristolochia californica]|uniref:transcription factor NIGT1 n=1 Tax=Aristolochia californica TaxID=171875 RepID=UPI0035D83FA7